MGSFNRNLALAGTLIPLDDEKQQLCRLDDSSERYFRFNLGLL